MIINQSSKPVRMIRQPEHARLSGELALHWGNDLFRMPEPAGLLQTAAALHDIGWMEWETRPETDPETGLPFNFMGMPFAGHIRIWERGVEMAETVNRFVALMVSRHNMGLLGYTDISSLPEDEAGEARRFISGQSDKQERWIAQLKADPQLRHCMTEDHLNLCSGHLSAWDYMSLWVCMNLDEAGKEETIRTGPFRFDIRVRSRRVRVHPWPFSPGRFNYRIESKLEDNSVEFVETTWDME